MKMKIKWTKEQMIISSCIATILLGGSVYAFSKSEKEINAKEIKPKEVSISELEKEGKTTEGKLSEPVGEEVKVEEKQSIISKTTDFTYDRVFYQNGLLVADRADDIDVFDGELNMLETTYSFPSAKESLATTHDRQNHISGTAVTLNEEDAIYATYFNREGYLDAISIGMTESQTNGRRLMTQVANEYNVFAQTEFVNNQNQAYAHLKANDFHESNYKTETGSSVSDINQNGYFTVIKDSDNRYGDSFVNIYDAGLRNVTDDNGQLEFKKIETTKLMTASNLNDKNQMVMQQFTTGLVDDPSIWTFYDLDTDTSFNFPSHIEIVRFYNSSLQEFTDGTLGEIGMADNLIYFDKSEGLKPNDTTPSNTDYLPMKQGIISKDGRIIREPFAQQILKPNSNGVAPYQLETEGQFGLINVNTGEVIKEPFADNIVPFNENGLSSLSNNSKASIVNEKGEVIEETDYLFISPLTNDNTGTYREYENADLGILKIVVK